MTIVFENPTTFFHDLLQQSSQTHRITIPEEVQVYVLHLLVDSLTNTARIDLDSSLSLKYLEAAYIRDEASLKQVGDSCLFMLGLFPTHRPEHHSLYHELGPTSYFGLRTKVYNQLSTHFTSTVNLLLGVHLLLSTTNALCVWNATHSRIARNVLREYNIIPLRRKV